MPKKIIIITLTILVITISATGYFYFGNNQTEEKNQNSTANSSTSNISYHDPAFYIQHGTADRNIPITQSENLTSKLSSVIGKEKVTFEKIEGAGHGGSQFETSSNLDKIFAFLDSQLK